MNAGRDYTKAKKHAQANADRTGTPRWLHQYGGVYWISYVEEGRKIQGAELIQPTKEKANGS